MLTPHQGFTYNKFEKPNDWPKLKDTFDYQIENGKLLGGNKNLYLSGPVTYTVVGNPTITDGVASGFSASSCLQLSSAFPSLDNFEMVFKVKQTASVFSSIIGTSNGADQCGISFALAGGANAGRMRLWLSSNGSTWDIANDLDGNKTFAVNSYRYLKVSFDGAKYAISSSTDGITWEEENYVNSTTKIYLPNTAFYIGANKYSLGADQQYMHGEIDLNVSYIKVNDRLWFYGKNYTTKNMVPVPQGLEYNNTTTPEIGWVYTSNELVKGLATYTKVGNPKIVNGVVSEFSNNNLLTIPAMSFTGNFVCQIKFTPNSFNTCTLFGGRNVYTIGWWLLSDKTVRFCLNLSDGINTNRQVSLFKSNVLTEGNTYICKATRNGQIVNFIIYENGIIKQTSSYTISEGYDWTTSGQGSFGLGKGNDSNTFLNGSIDLNETYMVNNGEPWFGSASKFQEFIPAPQGTMIGKDDSNMLQVESKNNIGTIGYTVVGSPTIVDGIAHLSNGNYFDFENFPFASANWEIGLKADTDYVQGQAQQRIVSRGNSFYFRAWGNTLRWQLYNGTDHYIGDENCTVKNYPFVRIVKTNSGVDFYLSADGKTYTKQAEGLGDGSQTDGTLHFGLLGGNGWEGTLDLNHTYIKVNGQAWFGTLPAEPKLVGPVDYTVEGSPTISDGVASGFSNSNYLQTPVFNPGSSPWEIVFEFTTGATFKSQGVLTKIGSDKGLTPLYITGTGAMCTWASSDGIHEDIAEGVSYGIVVANTTYKVKYEFTVTEYKISLWEDGNWSLKQTINSSLTIAGTTPFAIGNNGGTSAPFAGSINLNNLYIKVNGALWFGKEDWKPSTYTDNAIYLLGSHKADYSNYNELSLTPSIETESDEVGSYNVWIDNQKVIENKTGNTLLEWDKLALTTGYSITTPSALKAHAIKIEPTNSTDSIIAFNTEIIEESDESI